MSQAKPRETEISRSPLRVLVHAPFGKDGDVICRVLERAGVETQRCANVEEFLALSQENPGAVIIADEALNQKVVQEFASHLRQQPPWSDLPVIVMTSGGDADEGSIYRLTLLKPLGNLTLLERPLRKVTLVSAIQTALRARSRQHDIRNYIDQKKQSEEELRQSEQRWRFLANTLPQLIWVVGPDQGLEFINDYWLDYTGNSSRLPKSWQQVVHPEDVHLLTSELPGEAREQTFEFRVRRVADSAWRWHLGLLKPEQDETGKIFRWIGAGIDIHDRRETEAALRRANAALEQFAYAAAHDLQEPVRTIAVYTQLVATSCKGKLDETGEQYLRFTIEGAQRMQNLIHDLFSYTRALDEQTPGDTECDAEKVMVSVIENLRTAIDEAGAEVTCEPLPRVAVSEAHLTQLLQNLVSNALKYRGEQTPRIHVSAVERNEEWIFSVRDNGQGIAREHHQKIFQVFKRLHGREVPGTGIGLAICERVVLHYGGKIWLDSTPKLGTTFYFSLPAVRAGVKVAEG